ncbi:hypothetical protein D9758_014689 [Tetrapyrgos nigripes]|uniref:Tyrosinase copper-binding domain-containing protein n=1 Tax=Tetrapyrgos nigripes TaxID=182062 RepID=A0A8H5CLG7_9AGAR|nr:hypothetical protein D9758_014689 [Tetrapyrgos nigripes]
MILNSSFLSVALALALQGANALSVSVVHPSATPDGSGQGNNNSTCSNPSIRREWRTLSRDEKKNFIDGVRCLSQLPASPDLQPTGDNPDNQPRNTSSTLYDDFVYIHMDGLQSLHVTGRFFPWHRLFLHAFESHLKNQCGFTGALPYWDFTQDSANILASTAFDADPEAGLGAWPDASTNFTVTTGGFRDLPYLDPGVSFPFEYSDPELEANSTQTPENWQNIVGGSRGNFTAFQLSVDGHRLQGMHPSTHVSAGGPEGDVTNLATSPSDPIFWLLHAQLDRLWWQWQTYHPDNFEAISGGETQDLVHVDDFPTGTGTPVTANTTLFMSNLFEDKKIGDVFDIMGGYLCYDYVQPNATQV